MSHELDWTSVRVLVVDADKDFFRVVANILNTKNVAKIEHMASGSEALDLLKWDSFDVVITEYRLTELNGLTFAEILRNRKASPRLGVPIIMLTGYGSEPLLRKAIRAGIDYFLVKPISPKALCGAIEKLLLTPLAVTKTKSYLGPCRRRMPTDVYSGKLRRVSDEVADAEHAQAASG